MNLNTDADVAPRRISAAWPAFSGKLADVLARLAEDQYLIISIKRSNRFVQFAGQGAFGMRAEAVCNAYLPAPEQLGPEQIARLQAIGWQMPTGSPEQATPDQDPDGSPNFFIDLSAPVEFGALTVLATRALVEAMGAQHPGRLEYTSFDSHRNTLVWPELGLKRAGEVGAGADVRQSLLATLKAETSIPDLDFDADGDIALRYGSVLVWIRVTDQPPQVRMVAALLREVEESDGLLTRLNELNASAGHPMFFASHDCVFAALNVPAVPYVADHVVQALQEFCRLTDGIDKLLQSEFGGRTAFLETMPSTLRH